MFVHTNKGFPKLKTFQVGGLVGGAGYGDYAELDEMLIKTQRFLLWEEL